MNWKKAVRPETHVLATVGVDTDVRKSSRPRLDQSCTYSKVAELDLADIYSKGIVGTCEPLIHDELSATADVKLGGVCNPTVDVTSDPLPCVSVYVLRKSRLITYYYW